MKLDLKVSELKDVIFPEENNCSSFILSVIYFTGFLGLWE